MSSFKDLNSSLMSPSDASSGTWNRTPFNCKWENWSLFSWVQGLNDSSSNFRFFSGLLCTSLRTSDRPKQFFNLCSNVFKFEIDERPIMPMPCSPRFNMQLIFFPGLQYECPQAVLATNVWSRLRNFCKAIILVFL